MTVEEIRFYLRICMIVAGISATVFVILYARSRWNETWLGRTLMFQGVSLAAALDLVVIMRYWRPGERVILIVYAIVFTFLAISTATMSYQMWINNYRRRKKVKNDRQHPG